MSRRPAPIVRHQQVRTSTNPPAMAGPTDEDALPHGLTVTFWFEPRHGAGSSTATLRLTGRRLGAARRLGPGDSFVRNEVVEGIPPGSGPVSVTTRVLDVTAGEWEVSAQLLQPAKETPRHPARGRPVPGTAVHRAAWSWRRWRVTSAKDSPIRTRFAPLTGFDRQPAVIPGSWVALVLLGVAIGVVAQRLVLGARHLDGGSVLAVALVTVATGLLGAKIWFQVLARRWRLSRDGWCIQGALAGGAVAFVAGVAALRLPLGTVLDASTPGLFLGVAVGRVGCFLTGCCAGRPSSSRWAIWSSDRRIGARRIPTQLLESAAALLVAATGFTLVLTAATATPGAVVVGSFAAHTLLRQFPLRLRLEQRRSSRGTHATAAVAAAVLIGSVAAMVVHVAG